MATDYSKLKNDELQALLKERSLPHTGKKADMVSRLQEDDAKNTSSSTDAPTTTAPAAAATTSKEDEIDWDDGADATTEPAAAAIAAGGQGPVANPAAVPNQAIAEDPAQTDDLTAAAPAGNGAAPTATDKVSKVEEKPAVDFTSGIKALSEVEELKARLKRGEKFGTISAEEKEDIQKKIERAEKFGTDNASVALNEALPERKRRREGGDDGGRGGKRGGRGLGRGGRRGPRGPREDRPQEVQSGRGGWMSEADRAAAEKRKNRFTA